MRHRVLGVTFLFVSFYKETDFARFIFPFSREKRIYLFLFSAGAMRSYLRATGICQDRDVYVDVHRGSVPAQHGDW